MTSEQLTRVCSALADKWRAGSHWPPDLAEFVSIVAECSGGVFGLTVEDVMAENKRWRNVQLRREIPLASPGALSHLHRTEAHRH